MADALLSLRFSFPRFSVKEPKEAPIIFLLTFNTIQANHEAMPDPKVADADKTSSQARKEIVKGLNEDLAREYKAIIQYVVFSATLKGAEYNDIADQLKQHASQELAHALEIARQIDYLGGDPTIKPKDAEYSDESKEMLKIDLRAEEDTIKNYRERIQQAERAGEYALSEALRDIIAEEQDHEIDLRDALGLR
jgi:bacterioferritin